MNATIRVAAVAAILGVLGCDRAIELPVEPQQPAPQPAVLGIVAGNNQTGAAGERLPERLVVRVTDSAGKGVPSQWVKWTVTSGGGYLYDHVGNEHVAVDATVTAGDGTAAVRFMPDRLGTSTITVAVVGRSIEPVTFTAHVAVLVISNAYWGYFLSPDGTPDASIPVGTPVEWVNVYSGLVEIESTAVPAGGTWFTVQLRGGGRFRLAPEVVGTWQWTYRYYDEAGVVTWESEETRTLDVHPDA
jgi:hypothetical protein